MSRTVIATIALTTLFGALSAQAATIYNRDESDHGVVVVENGERKEFNIPAQRELTGICTQACQIFIGSDPDPYDVAAADILRIEGGALQYETEPAPAPDGSTDGPPEASPGDPSGGNIPGTGDGGPPADGDGR